MGLLSDSHYFQQLIIALAQIAVTTTSQAVHCYIDASNQSFTLIFVLFYFHFDAIFHFILSLFSFISFYGSVSRYLSTLLSTASLGLHTHATVVPLMSISIELSAIQIHATKYWIT
mgnify:CR=1 FL=1